jgi:Amt family ammonium transporter
VATAAAALAWMVAEWAVSKKPSVLGMVSGAVAGLVAITPASGYVDASGALFIGLAAGVVCYLSAVHLKHRFGYDDALDCWGVHGVGGALGALLTGVFALKEINPAAAPKGGLLEGNAHQLVLQVLDVGATFVYCAVVTALILFVLKVTIGIRVSEDVEREGLDINLHGEVVHA